MRVATYKEVERAYREQRLMQEWREVIDFAKQLYGEHAHKVVTIADHNFDDGEENRYLVAVEAYATDGTKLSYNFALPFWQQKSYGGKTYSMMLIEAIEQTMRVQREGGYQQTHVELLEDAVRDVIHDDLPTIRDLEMREEYYADEPPYRETLVLYVDR